MERHVLLFLWVLAMFTSCVVQSPKYTSIEQVMTLKVGMSKVQVEEHLGIKPYDVKKYDDTCNVFVYIYRVTDRRTFSFNTKPVNGKEVVGKYLQLDVTYSLSDTVLSIETCRQCDNKLETINKINFEKVILFITVTLPLILIYLGLN